MNGTNHFGIDTVLGTIGGTLLATVPHLDSIDLLRTIILGGIGGVVSFIVTQTCRWLWSRIKIRFSRKGSRDMLNRHKKRDTKIKKNDKN